MRMILLSELSDDIVEPAGIDDETDLCFQLNLNSQI